MPDWKKEIKLSDLYRRSGKQSRPERAEQETAATEATGAERKSLLKRDLGLSFSRKTKQPKVPKDPKPEKETGRRGRSVRVGIAAPVPGIPLMRAFNLLPKDDPREAGERRPTTPQLVLAVVALVAIAVLGSYFLLLSARVADRKATSNDLHTRLAALNVPSEEPKAREETDPALVEERLQRTGALAAALGARTAWDRLLREFSLVLPEDVSLTKLTATSATPAVTDPAPAPPPTSGVPISSFTIEGYTETQEGVALLLSRLSVLPELGSVTLQSSTLAEVGAQEVVQFAITAVVKPVPGATA